MKKAALKFAAESVRFDHVTPRSTRPPAAKQD